MSLGTIRIIILILVLIGVVSTWVIAELGDMGLLELSALS
jgi:hypothetical protein